MAFSYVDYSVSTTTTGPFSFAAIDGYLSVDHIYVYKNGVLLNPTQYTLEVDPPQIVLDTAAVSGDTLRIRRITPNTEDGVIVPFQDGSILRSRDLRVSQLQALFVAQEFADSGVLIPGGSAGPTEANVGDLITWDGEKFIFTAPGTLGLDDGIYGDIVVSGAGSSWAIKDGVYGAISVSSGGSVWTVTGAAVPDGDYGDVVVSNNGTVWTVEGLTSLPPNATYGDITVASASSWHITDGVYGDVTVSNNGGTWTVAGGVGATLDGGNASSTYTTTIDGGSA